MKTLPNYAGLVDMRRARATGTLVGVYRSAEAGIEDDPEGAWATVCEPHGGCVTHRTRALAEQWAPYPNQWCPTCQGEVPDPHATADPQQPKES